jgi:undecaprenyl-diphosphatase
MDYNAEKRDAPPPSVLRRALTWIGRHELTVLLSFALIVGGIWLTAVLADGVLEGDTQEIDLMILMALRDGADTHNPLGPPWVEEMMRDFTSLGGTGVLSLIVLAVSFYYLIQGRYKEMLILITAVIGAYMLSYFLKGLFARPRPEFIPAGEYVHTASFPSGHALLAATTYLTLGIIVAQLMPRSRLKAFVLLLSFFVMLLVGFTRMYLGVHWPTDVLAGWVIGSVWAIFCWLVVRWLRRKGYVRPASFV